MFVITRLNFPVRVDAQMVKAAKSMKNSSENIEARRVRVDVSVDALDHDEWKRARPASISHYWSGAAAPAERHAEARVVWSDAALSVRFACRQKEPLIVSSAPNLTEKTIGLWERDVCEIFIAPDARAPERYYEFEAAPTGEWLDLAIHHTPAGRETDWGFRSRMETAARVDEDEIVIALRVPWAAFGGSGAPRAGERWRANLFRCVGRGETGYLAWRPTCTTQPNFHVPEAFGWLAFGEFA